jgi:hypothetical protein
MNYYLRVYSTAFLVLISFWAKAQIQVTFPTSRAVIQRNNANQATLRITGYYTTAITRVEARLVVRDGIGTATDWLPVQTNPTGGVYAGDLTGTGGWYNLEVRAMNGSQQVGSTTTVERVGIGEVFVIAGQSNAQGVHQNAPNPLNDLVNCVNSSYGNSFPTDPTKPVFTQLDNSDGFTIAPRGVGSWCWGQLGDILVKRLRVPIMFFNAGFAGTAVRNWRESAPEGGTAYSVYIGEPYGPRQPYINLKLSLQFYANMLGVRAVLWHQGEADNLINTPTQDYVNDLNFVINQARQDYNQTLSWVVSRASYGDNIGGTDAAVIAAQNQVINSTPNVFAGPNTDVIQVPRKRPPLNELEALHFDFNGLIDVANAWNASMTDTFFQNSTPVAPAPTPTVSIECAGSNSIKVSVAGNYSTVLWDSGESGNTITKGTGIYQAKIKDARGNTFYSSKISVNAPPTITVVNNRPASICVGSSLALTTNYDNNVTWVNQQANANVANTQQLAATTAGTYFVRYRDVSGCDFTSNSITLAVNPLPQTPVVTNTKPTTFCQGDNTTLQVSNDNVQYNWTGGQAGKVITATTSGAYFLTVTDQNGCTSAQSNTVIVTANPVPVKPVIATSGSTVFCADRTITLTAPQNVAYQWTSGQTSQAITLNQSGNFSVRTTNQFGCTSVQSDAVTVQVNPLPQIPTVSATGATTFCEGNSVTLNANSPVGVVWSSGQTEKSISVNRSGNYSVQARDQNGCISTYSPVVAVKVNELPATPTILANPSTVICDGDKVTLRVEGPYSVSWSTGESTPQITTDKAGTYSVRVQDANGCISAQAGSASVELKPLPPPPTINVVGTYTLQAVASTNGTQFRWSIDNALLGFDTSTIKANKTGSYTSRSSIVYSPTLTCFSLPSTPLLFTVDPNNKGLSVYPNPNPDKILTLETEQNLTNASITIYSLTGQVLLTTTVPLFNDRKVLSLTGMPPGQYIIRVQATNFDVAKRISLGL